MDKHEINGNLELNHNVKRLHWFTRQVVPDVSGDVEDEPLNIFGRFRISQNLTVIHTLEDMMVNLKKRNWTIRLDINVFDHMNQK